MATIADSVARLHGTSRRRGRQVEAIIARYWLEIAALALISCSELPEVTTTVPAVVTPGVALQDAPTPTDLTAATVLRIVDGDTLDVGIGNERFRVRLLTVDTPEVFGEVQCFGPEASVQIAGLIPVGSTVLLERDVSETDRFGRLLRYVYREDGSMVNELLVVDGYAAVSTYPPDVKYVDRLVAAQRVAVAELRGLWGVCVVARGGELPR